MEGVEQIYVDGSGTVRSRTYRRRIAFSTFGLAPQGWMLELLLMMSQRAKFKPEPTADLMVFRYAFDMVMEITLALEIMNLPAQEVRVQEMRRLFVIMEEALLVSDKWTTSVKARIGTYFRKYIFHSAVSLPFPEPLNKKTVRFRTAMYVSFLPRGMLSDSSEWTTGDEAISSPLSAMPHSDVGQLRTRLRQRVELDLQKVISACIAELKIWETARETLLGLSKQSFSAHEVELCRAANTIGSKGVAEEFQRLSPERCLGLHVRAVRENNLAGAIENRTSFVGIRTLIPTVLGLSKLQCIGVMPRHILFLVSRINSNELIAAFVLLLCYTGWNAHSLVNLTSDRVVSEDTSAQLFCGQTSIQGFKSKTDDDTPFVILDKTNPYAIYALRLMVWNQKQLKSLSLLEADESRLWFSYTVGGGYMDLQYIGFQGALDQLIVRHGLAKFSFEQIRTQVLMAEQLRSQDIESVRVKAGHAEIASTGRYLDQQITRRLNSAINLEFQRRLENTVHFRMEEAGCGVGMVIQPERIDERLVMPIGDGASCANPADPPYEEYLKGDICMGERCHTGNGCANRRIIIDSVRIEELVRKRKYYQENWARLRVENSEKFETVHSPRLLFTLGLYDFIKNSSSAHVLHEIEKKLGSE